VSIVAFPGGEAADPQETWIVELDAALDGESQGPAAESWRELRDDVRALAPAMTPAFEERLRERLAHQRAPSHNRRRVGWTPGFGWTRALLRPRAVAAIAGVLVTAAVVLVIGLGGARRPGSGAQASSHTSIVPHSTAAPAQSAPVKGEENGRASDLAPAAGGPSIAQGRVQQLAAAVSLSTSPGNVQGISDGVARLAVRDEGYVQQSHVQVQQHGSSEASLILKLPSARLAVALAAIARLAPVSSENQSLQDITNAYDAARQRLADARAERQALLRALASAGTEGQIDSLRERLSQARSAIAQDQSALQAVSQRASTAEVEVTVLANAAASSTTSEGLTLHRGLHDALRVLTVALIVILIAGAALVPGAFLILALAGARRVWVRRERERALDAG
jgi:Domain of unknown function (DUF4349)